MKHTRRFFALLTAVIIAAASITALPAQARDAMPTKVTISKSSMKVSLGSEFEIRANVKPLYAEDDYIRWQIVSGKSCVKFTDYDHDGDEVDLKAVKAGTAVVRCYVAGKDKTKYGDTIKIKVKGGSKNYYLAETGSLTKHEEVRDDFDLEVRKGSKIKNSQLKWSIADTSIVDFVYGNTGKHVEFYAKKVGTTKITCKCTNANAKPKKITYTVKVTYDYD